MQDEHFQSTGSASENGISEAEGLASNADDAMGDLFDGDDGAAIDRGGDPTPATVGDEMDDTATLSRLSLESQTAPEPAVDPGAMDANEPVDDIEVLEAAAPSEPDGPQILTGSRKFPSHDGESMVSWRFWAPSGRPRAIIQLVHGMAEHIGRYDDLARHFAAEGYLVAGHDHIGHGETAASKDDLGHMPMLGGDDILVNDTHALATYLDQRFPGLPHILYGHSMGSFIVRVYLSEWGDEVDAAILSGTATFPRLLTRMGLGVTEGLAAIHGERAHSDLVNDIAVGTYNAAIDDPRTDFDWIAADDAVVDAYVADERSGFQFTLGGYGSLLRLIIAMIDPKNAAKVPKDLPLLFIAGDEDPVGDMGNGVRDAAGFYMKAGLKHVDVRIYPGMRHEVHNEKGREKVLEDVSAWLEEFIEPSTGTRFSS